MKRMNQKKMHLLKHVTVLAVQSVVNVFKSSYMPSPTYYYAGLDIYENLETLAGRANYKKGRMRQVGKLGKARQGNLKQGEIKKKRRKRGPPAHPTYHDTHLFILKVNLLVSRNRMQREKKNWRTARPPTNTYHGRLMHTA
jgi:hypothetical protein